MNVKANSTERFDALFHTTSRQTDRWANVRNKNEWDRKTPADVTQTVPADASLSVHALGWGVGNQ